MLTTVHYLPIACFILLPSTFIITYMISILLNHCEVAWPYISDTGVHIPESCIFSQLLNIASTLIALTILIRYKQVEQQCRDNLISETHRVLLRNKMSLMVGIVSAAGLSIVANFQELQLFTVHMIGAFSAFGFGLIYCILQTRISYNLSPYTKSGLLVARYRFVLSVILGITFTISSIFGPISLKYFNGTDTTNWKPRDGGYTYHVISSVCEWISALAIDFFILSFAHEFKYMSISSPQFYFISKVPDVRQETDSDSGDYGVVNVVATSTNNQSSSSRPQRKHTSDAADSRN